MFVSLRSFNSFTAARCSHGSKLGSDAENRPWARLLSWFGKLGAASRLNRGWRCSSISRQLVTPYGVRLPAALKLLNDHNKTNTSAAHFAHSRWSTEWQKSTSRLHQFIADISSSPPGMNFPRPVWVRLNRLRTGVGLFRSTMYKWGKAFSAACECGAEEQTADHVIATCSNCVQDLEEVNENLLTWLTEICPAI